MPTDGRIALTALFGSSICIFVLLPIIYLPDGRIAELAHKAPIFTAVIAFVALVIAGLTLGANRKNQRETTAKANFREFLKLCVEYPDFAYGIISKPKKREKYEWFVAHFLWAAEELLEFTDGDLIWEENLKLHISYHRGFLQYDGTFRSEDLPAYSEKLRRLIDRTLATLPPGV